MANVTNEEFKIMKAADSPFIEALHLVIVKFFAVKKGEEFTTFLKTPFGNYVWKANKYVGEIDQNLEDIALTLTLLKEHDPCRQKLKREDNSAVLIRYHYENFILRVGKVKDLMLLLINQVMMLEVKKNTNMEAQVLKKMAPLRANFELIWDQVKDQMDPIKPFRNHLAHNGTMQHDDLALLNAYYQFEMKFENLVEEFRHERTMSNVQGELVDEFTGNIEIYTHNIDELLKLVYTFLTHPFMDNLKKLSKK
jgi:hypothetical protein